MKSTPFTFKAASEEAWSCEKLSADASEEIVKFLLAPDSPTSCNRKFPEAAPVSRISAFIPKFALLIESLTDSSVAPVMVKVWVAPPPTEILIDDGDCVVELNPSNQNNDQVENTGVSDEKGLLMGDFRLVKNPKQKIRKEDAIQTPKLNTQKKRQAF